MPQILLSLSLIDFLNWWVQFNNSCPKFVGNESEVPAEMQSSTPIELSTMSATNTQKLSRSAVSASKEKSNTLVQATISTLFKKADEKEEDDDDIDEFSSTPKDTNGSDEDWAV
ncbi:uncharacterized protein LOC110807558 isoform X2 [Carica papaya]|uniref:uncharacterized protein LOC110807558 isoform X2 n=1 Tax=Carica papaya TaxID=3649 RepID=UPI000B8C8626|nr:uncharacterized protein LOC110807558 isoform X2 [Carica papaya]